MPFWIVRVNDSLQRIVEAETEAQAEDDVRRAVEAGLRFTTKRVRGELQKVLAGTNGAARRALLPSA